MRSIPSALQAKLDSGVTTLCRCWKLQRRDGLIMGFTDHDQDIVLDGLTFLAGTGLSATEATSRLGLAIDGAEISGALADESLTEADLAAGAMTPRILKCFWWTGATQRCACCWRAALSVKSGGKGRPSPQNCAAWRTG